MTEARFNIQYRGIELTVDVNRGVSKLDGKHWVDTQEVWHCGKIITALLGPLELCQIERIIAKELNT
jgi:hypothetical protein